MKINKTGLRVGTVRVLDVDRVSSLRARSATRSRREWGMGTMYEVLHVIYGGRDGCWVRISNGEKCVMCRRYQTT